MPVRARLGHGFLSVWAVLQVAAMPVQAQSSYDFVELRSAWLATSELTNPQNSKMLHESKFHPGATAVPMIVGAGADGDSKAVQRKAILGGTKVNALPPPIVQHRALVVARTSVHICMRTPWSQTIVMAP